VVKTLSILLALAALGTGIKAAFDWFRSTKVEPKKGWDLPVGSIKTELKELSDENGKIDPKIVSDNFKVVLDNFKVVLDNFDAFTSGILLIKDALRESSSLNKTAAIWTAISVVLSAASALLGSFAPN
jgi:hypothetical protein